MCARFTDKFYNCWQQMSLSNEGLCASICKEQHLKLSWWRSNDLFDWCQVCSGQSVRNVEMVILARTCNSVNYKLQFPGKQNCNVENHIFHGSSGQFEIQFHIYMKVDLRVILNIDSRFMSSITWGSVSIQVQWLDGQVWLNLIFNFGINLNRF